MKKFSKFCSLVSIGLMSLLSQRVYSQSIQRAIIKSQNGSSNNSYSHVSDDFLSFYVQKQKEESPQLNIKKLDQKYEVQNIKAKNFNFYDNSPIGVLNNTVSSRCLTSELDNATLSSGLTANEFAKKASKYFENCGSELANIHNTGLAGLIEYTLINYKFAELKEVNPVEFLFEDGEKLRGFIAVQDNSPRPWVIIKCGIFCDVEGEGGDSISTYLMHLFDQGPFNIIYLGNRTGYSHIRDNQSLTMGGYLESHDLFEVSRWLQMKSQFKNLVTEVHALGVSLGTSSALFASRFEDIYKKTPQAPEKFFDSVATVCPVVDLASTVQDLTNSTSITAQIFSYYTSSKIEKAKPHLLNTAGDILHRYGEPSIDNLFSMLGDLSSHFGSMWGSSPYYQRDLPVIHNSSEYWRYNNFAESITSTQTPTLLVASDDDMIVSSEFNTRYLEKVLKNKKQSNIGMINLPEGTHCALTTAYGFSTVSTLFRNFYIDHSPNYYSKMNSEFKSKKIKYNFDFPEYFLKDGTHLRQIWMALENSPFAKLTFEVFAPDRNYDCQHKTGQENCKKIIERIVPLNELGFDSKVIAKNEAEVQRLTRQLNYKIKVKSNGQPIEQSNLVPNELEIIDL